MNAPFPPPIIHSSTEHLIGSIVPPIALPATNGEFVRLDNPAVPWAVVYCYPRISRPGEEPLGGAATWDAIPGARGCTPQSCAYRDRHAELKNLGAVVYGLSTSTTEAQREARARLHLPFELLSDHAGDFYLGLKLPFFEVAGERVLQRLTLIIHNGRIVHCFPHVQTPAEDAAHVMEWLRKQN